MVIENFSREMINSTIFRTYIATGFFAILIFFILNSHIFTPYEMVLGTIIATIALKGISNIMISAIILLFDLQSTKDEYALKLAEDKLDLLMNQMKTRSAKTVQPNTN
jgi:hypothetical protein